MIDARSVVLGAQISQNLEHADRGIPRYVTEHVAALARRAPDLISHVALDPHRGIPPSLARWLGRVPIEYDVRRAPTHGRPSIYHAMCPLEILDLGRVWPEWARRGDVKLVATIYDVIPLLYPRDYLSVPAFRQRYLARLDMFRTADAVLAISETTAADAVAHLGLDPAKIHNISAASAACFRMPDRPPRELMHDLRQRFPRLRDDFIFCTGGIDPRKNVEGLIAGYAQLPEAVRSRRQLVVTCTLSMHSRSHLMSHARQAGVERNLILTGHVPDDVLVSLYQACGVFAFPSLYEGFGLPVLEAMQCGAPVVVSDTPALRELVGDPQARFDPASASAIRDTLLRASEDRKFRERLRAASPANAERFTWNRVADRTVAAYETVAALRKPVSLRRRRWAVFAPMPPTASGVADHDARLIEALLSKCDVDVFVQGDPATLDRPGDPRIRLARIRDFEWRRHLEHYDQIIYSLGNSGFHTDIWQAFMKHPGVVLVHDLRFTGLYWWLERTLGETGFFRRKLDEMYGGRLSSVLVDDRQAVTSKDAAALGLFMAREILLNATQVIVLTEAARQIALLECPEIRGRVHVVPLPFAEPEPPPAVKHDPVISTFGIVDESKLPRLIIRAFALIRRIVPTARLTIVGLIDPEDERELTRLANGLGVGDALECTGRLPRHAYRDRLRHATVAVQLRETSHGEMSGSVGDCLGAGLPTIVSDIGGLSELPRSVVVHVPLGVTDKELALTILTLLDDPARRQMLCDAALAYVANHGARQSAEHLWKVLQ